MNYLTLNIFGFSCRSISSIVIIASLVGIFVFTAGCHSNSGISEPVFPVSDDISHVRNDHVSIIDGRLSFASMDDFKEFMGSIINKSDSYLDSVQSDMNFISLRSDTETMADKLGKDVDELEVVEDHFFSTVLNSNGEFQIEDTVYKITRDFVYSVPHSDSHHLNSILLRDNSHDTLNAKTTFDPIVTVFAIERSDLEVADKTNFLRRMSECEAYLNGRRRVKGQAWFTNWRVYMSATTELEFQRKGWFRWSRTGANWIKLDANYSITEQSRFSGIPPAHQPPPRTVTGEFSKTKHMLRKYDAT